MFATLTIYSDKQIFAAKILSSGIQDAEDFLVDIGEFFEGFEVDNVLLVTQKQLLWGM